MSDDPSQGVTSQGPPIVHNCFQSGTGTDSPPSPTPPVLIKSHSTAHSCSKPSQPELVENELQSSATSTNPMESRQCLDSLFRGKERRRPQWRRVENSDRVSSSTRSPTPRTSPSPPSRVKSRRSDCLSTPLDVTIGCKTTTRFPRIQIK